MIVEVHCPVCAKTQKVTRGVLSQCPWCHTPFFALPSRDGDGLEFARGCVYMCAAFGATAVAALLYLWLTRG